MKLVNQVKLLILSSLICLCLTRTERKKTKTDTNNKMARQLTVQLFLNADKNPSVQPSVGTIDAKTIKVPKNEEVRGLNIKFTTLNDDLKALLTENTGNFYLSYRRLSSEFQVLPNNSAGRIITVLFQKSSNEFHNLKIQFEYDPEWEVITEQEVFEVVSWLNRNRIQRINAVTALKTLAFQSASEYKTQSATAEAATKGAKAIDAQIEATQKLIVSKEAELAENNNKLAELEKSILTKNTQINTLSDDLIKSKKTMDHIDSQIILKLKALQELSAELSTGNVSAQTYKTSMENQEASFKAGISILSAEAPSSSSELNKAFDILKESGSKIVEELFGKTFPK